VNELEQTIDEVAKGISGAENYGSAIIGISKDEAQTLINAAQLVAPLQERCQLLGRALSAVWSLVNEEDQQTIAEFLDVPHTGGKTLPASTLVQMIERRGAALDGGKQRPQYE
jgi:hypothetical protein